MDLRLCGDGVFVCLNNYISVLRMLEMLVERIERGRCYAHGGTYAVCGGSE